MGHRRLSRIVIFFVVIGLIIVGATAVYAGNASVSGTVTPGGATMPVVFISTPNCTGQGVIPVLYATHTLRVDTAGVYSINLTDTPAGAFSLYLQSAGFNPANGFPTCLAADNAGAIGFSYALTANTTYILVPIDDTFAQAGGSYTITVTGPGTVCMDNQCAGGAGAINDGRLNKYDLAATYAVYCSADGFDVYAIDSQGHGSLALRTTRGEVAAVDASVANTLISEGQGIRAFKLTNGLVQVVGAPDIEGKVYNVVFDASACSLTNTFLN